MTHGVEDLEDRTSAPSRIWNRIPDDITDRIITMALDHANLSPRELAVKFTDTESFFVSEASVYRLLKAHDLITSPAANAKRGSKATPISPMGDVTLLGNDGKKRIGGNSDQPGCHSIPLRRCADTVNVSGES